MKDGFKNKYFLIKDKEAISLVTLSLKQVQEHQLLEELKKKERMITQ